MDQKIYNAVQLDPLFCEIETLRIDDESIYLTLKSDEEDYISFKVKRGTDEDTVCTVNKTAQLAEFILRDPLLQTGTKSIRVVVKHGRVLKATVRFYTHDIDMTSFFAAGFNARRALVHILQECQKKSPDTVCAITFEPVSGGERVCRIKGEQWEYGEAALKRWISLRGTSPFTRKNITQDDVEYLHRVREPVPMEQQPLLQPTRKRIRRTSTKHTSVVVDTSGSMSTCDGATESLKRYLAEIKGESKDGGALTVWTFSTDVQKLLHVDDIRTLDLPLTEHQNMMLRPHGATALYDAICIAGEDLLTRVGSGDTGVFCVLTDGQDTASDSHTRTDVQQIMNRLKENDITPVFLAANIGDARDAGARMGFDREASLTFTPQTVGAAYASLRQATQGTGEVVFSDVQRQMSAPI